MFVFTANAVSLNSWITKNIEVHKPANNFQVSSSCSVFSILSENRPLHGANPAEIISLDIDTTTSSFRHGGCAVTDGKSLAAASLSLKHPEGSLDLRRYWISWADEDMFVGQGFPMGLTALSAPMNGYEIVEKVSLDPNKYLACQSNWVLPPDGGGKRDGTTMESLTHWGRDKLTVISQTTFWNEFSWMKMYEFRLKFRWSLFLRVQLTIFQHWFR